MVKKTTKMEKQEKIEESIPIVDTKNAIQRAALGQ